MSAEHSASSVAVDRLGDQASDEALMHAYADGAAGAFERLYDRHERPVFRYLLRHLRAQNAAEDVLQDTWLTVVRNAAQFKSAPDAVATEATADATTTATAITTTITSTTGNRRFVAWLYAIARSRLVDHVRRQKYELSLDAPADQEADHDDGAAWIDQWPDDTPGPEQQAMWRETGARLVSAIEALPAPQRDTFLLHAEAGLSLSEIAVLTGVGIESAKSRLRYALAKLRGGMELMR